MATWFGEIKDWVKKDVMGSVVGQFGASSLRELFKKEAGEAGGAVGERIRRLVRENPRAELLYVMLTLDEEEAKKFWDNYCQKANDEGFEDTFIKTIAQALPRNKEGGIDFEKAKSIYTQILQMSPERFWKIYNELKHDPIAQRVKHWMQHGREFAEALVGAISFSAGKAAKFLSPPPPRTPPRPVSRWKRFFGYR